MIDCYLSKKEKLYYRKNQFKKKDTLVFIHGLMGSSSMWIKIEKELEDKYNIISIDIRGNGKSFRAKKYEDYSLDKFADDLYKILKKEKIKKTIIISHCFGNFVSIEFFKKHKKMVKAIVFISAYADQSHRKISKNIYNVVPLNVLNYFPTIKKEGFHLDYEKYTPAGDWDIKRSVIDFFNTGIKSELFILKHIFNLDYKEDIKKINIPVLIIHGNKDTVIPIKCGLDFKDKIKNSKISIIDANHQLVLNNKKEVLNEISDFIKKVQ